MTNLYRKLFFYILWILPIICFSFFVFNYSVNIPYWDDYGAVLEFTNSFLEDENTTTQRLALLFSQHNEHRIFFQRIVTISSYYLFGEINFKWLIILGNLGLTMISILLYKSYNYKAKYLFFFIPAVVFLFLIQPVSWESILWTSSVMQQFFVVLFSFLSFYFINKFTKEDSKREYFYYALFLAIITTFTMGNGLLTLIIGLGMLLHKKNYKYSVIWAFVAFLTLLAYFFNYQTPAHHPSLFVIFSYPLRGGIYFLNFLGSSFDFGFNKAVPAFLGFSSFIFLIFLMSIKFYKKNFLIYSYFLFIFFTAIMSAITRVGFGESQALASRYKIYSILWIMLLYFASIQIFDEYKKKIAFLHTAQIKKVLVAILCLIALNLGFLSYQTNIMNIESFRQRLIASSCLWNLGINNTVYHNQELGANIINKSIKNNIYNFPKFIECEFYNAYINNTAK